MKNLLLILLAFLTLPTLAQEEKRYIREGNRHYEAKKFPEAEQSYRKALDKKNDSFKAMFNLGDAYYKQGKYKEAEGQFEALTSKKTSRDTLAKVYHNLGNSLLMQKQYEKSITAYKKALKNDPGDDDTRYNLAYAQKMLKQQQQQQQQKDKNQQQDQQNKDQNKQDKNQDKGNEQDKNKKDQNKEGEQDKENQDQQKGNEEQQRQEQEISKERAQRLLDALSNDEKEIQKKLKKQQGRGKAKPESGKDW